ncbi:hypothetical protein AB0D66_01575 [Streptomyces sp. NPDC048270]|uniref:hypothetical protein n=1 Tax=Streptomyces sp. NPDC048270 TaxID=3154615 RepID=UPI0033D565D4
MTAAVSEAMRGALADWRRDGLLLCLLPVFCWPAVVAAVLTRPTVLVVLLSPVVLGIRELLAARWAGRALRDPAARWTSYEAVVVRRGWLPPVLVLEGRVEGLGGAGGPGLAGGAGAPGGPGAAGGAAFSSGHRGRLTLGLLGRRVLPPGPLAPASPPLPAGPSAAGPSAAGPSAAGPSAGGPSAGGPSAGGPSAAGPSAAGPSPGAPSPGGPHSGGPDPGDPASRTGVVRVLLAGDPAVGAVLWVPAARRLGRVRPARDQPRSRVSR